MWQTAAGMSTSLRGQRYLHLGSHWMFLPLGILSSWYETCILHSPFCRLYPILILLSRWKIQGLLQPTTGCVISYGVTLFNQFILAHTSWPFCVLVSVTWVYWSAALAVTWSLPALRPCQADGPHTLSMIGDSLLNLLSHWASCRCGTSSWHPSTQLGTLTGTSQAVRQWH